MKTLIFSRQSQVGKAKLDTLYQELDRLKINYQPIDVDSRDGAAQAELYDVVQTPAIITTQDDGKFLYSWQETLPQPSEISRLSFI